MIILTDLTLWWPIKGPCGCAMDVDWTLTDREDLHVLPHIQHHGITNLGHDFDSIGSSPLLD